MPEKRRLVDKINRDEMYWALGMGGRGGLLIAGPVLLGLVGGWFLDNRLGTLPWITLAFTAIGAVVGPLLAYRWITDAVRRRVARQQDRSQEGEDT
jgi:F0F1-type ATP synthase assembly protein I